jgi:hypothetical protein
VISEFIYPLAKAPRNNSDQAIEPHPRFFLAIFATARGDRTRPPTPARYRVESADRRRGSVDAHHVSTLARKRDRSCATNPAGGASD